MPQNPGRERESSGSIPYTILSHRQIQQMLGVKEGYRREVVAEGYIDYIEPRPRSGGLVGKVAALEHNQARRKRIVLAWLSGDILSHYRDKAAQGHHCPAYNIVKPVAALSAVAVHEGDIVESDGLGHGRGHLDFFADTVYEMEAASGPQDGERYAGETAPGAEVEDCRAVGGRYKLAYRQRVEDMVDVEIVYILARDDIYLAVPVGIERAEGGQLLSLARRYKWEGFDYFVHTEGKGSEKIVNFVPMNWIESLFLEHTPLQAVIVIAVIIAVGLGLGKIKVCGVSLGVTFVFFMGILAGHLGLSIDPMMLAYAESFGLVLFVYELGLKVGPGFFSSFRSGGVGLNILGLWVILLGTLMAVSFSLLLGIPMGDMIGVLSGATTNTPALGAAQQALDQLGMSAQGAALGCAVTYPLGVVGVILAMIVLRKTVVRSSDIRSGNGNDEADHTFVAAFMVENPGIDGLTIREVAAAAKGRFVISRLWREGAVTIPAGDTRLRSGDRLLVTTTDDELPELRIIFGHQEDKDYNADDIDWNALDSNVVSRHIVVTRPEINGKRLGSLRLRNSYDINISRVTRAGVRLLATPGLILQLGDRLTVVGEQKAIDAVSKLLGNTEATLRDPNLAAIFIGMVLGLVLGSIPIALPGISMPVKLGLAGGPMIVGILIGRFGPRLHLVTYTTRSANLMLRGIGLSLYLACLGLDAGAGFFDTIMRADGLTWIALGFLITVVPVLVMGAWAVRRSRVDFGSACGMVCGSMANPMALNYANDTLPGDNAAVAYATVYPLGMFVRVLLAQILVIAFA